MRTPSPSYCRLDLAPPSADRFIVEVAPSIRARYFSSCPSDSTSRWTLCPPENCRWGFRSALAGFRLSLSCPFRLLHTFHRLRPARHYPRVWIWHPSFGRQRDFDPPEQRAAQRTLRARPSPSRLSPDFPVSPVIRVPAPPISRRGEEGFSSCSVHPCHRAAATAPPECPAASVSWRRSMLPSPYQRGLGL